MQVQVIAQGARCAIAAHPNHPVPGSLPLQAPDEAVDHPRAGQVLRGIEVFNMNPSHSPFNRLSQEAARRLPLAQVGASDAHLASMVGAGITRFEGSSAANLRAAIESSATHPEQINFEAPGRILLRWLRYYGVRKLGWVTDNQEASRPPGWTRLKTA
jgi:predicted metal-dependent phosphoesterase TrpH